MFDALPPAQAQEMVDRCAQRLELTASQAPELGDHTHRYTVTGYQTEALMPERHHAFYLRLSIVNGELG
jgi:hypothetical protein